MSRLDTPTLREARGYVLVGVLVAAAIARAQELRNWARWTIHKAAELVPEPEEEDDGDA